MKSFDFVIDLFRFSFLSFGFGCYFDSIHIFSSVVYFVCLPSPHRSTLSSSFGIFVFGCRCCHCAATMVNAKICLTAERSKANSSFFPSVYCYVSDLHSCSISGSSNSNTNMKFNMKMANS